MMVKLNEFIVFLVSMIIISLIVVVIYCEIFLTSGGVSDEFKEKFSCNENDSAYFLLYELSTIPCKIHAVKVGCETGCFGTELEAETMCKELTRNDESCFELDNSERMEVVSDLSQKDGNWCDIIEYKTRQKLELEIVET